MDGFTRAERAWLTPPDESMPIAECECCGAELYEGEDVYKTQDGDYLCYNMQCVVDHFGIKNITFQNGEGHCEHCGEVIEEGDSAYVTDDGLSCYNDDCLRELLGVEYTELEREDE